MKKMKVLAKLKPQVGIWMDEAPIPEPCHNDISIKIIKTARRRGAARNDDYGY